MRGEGGRVCVFYVGGEEDRRPLSAHEEEQRLQFYFLPYDLKNADASDNPRDRRSKHVLYRTGKPDPGFVQMR